MLAVIIATAGVCFLLFPVELAYPPVPESELGAWAGLFHVADELNLTYNLLPSLHVALTVGCVAAFATHIRGAGQALLWIWAGAIALSTLLTHQHQVLDVLTGWLLAVLCFRYVYKPLAGP
jgi:membrane-associated phospholipid phosphatase